MKWNFQRFQRCTNRYPLHSNVSGKYVIWLQEYAFLVHGYYDLAPKFLCCAVYVIVVAVKEMKQPNRHFDICRIRACIQAKQSNEGNENGKRKGFQIWQQKKYINKFLFW